MNEHDAKKHIKALRAFHGHLLMYVLFIGCLAVVNFTTFLRGDHEIWVIYPMMFWGAVVLLQGVGTYGNIGAGKRWEEDKLRELTGWTASDDELARLAQRADTLLRILSDEDGRELGPALQVAKQRLLDAKRAIAHYRSPIEGEDDTGLTKLDVIDIIEKLEDTLTRREFQRIDSGARTQPHLRSAGES